MYFQSRLKDISVTVIYAIPKQNLDYNFEVSATKKCDGKNISY